MRRHDHEDRYRFHEAAPAYSFARLKTKLLFTFLYTAMVSADRRRMPHFCPFLNEAWNVVPYNMDATNMAPEMT